MTAHRDPDRLIHEFLLEGADQLHDQVYDAVRVDIEHRRQRAVIGPWRMPDIMNRLVPIGLGTAAVVGALLIGTQYLGAPAPGGVGAPPTAPASPQPTPAPIPDSGEIEAGTYLVSDGQSTIRVAIPAGWDVVDGTDIRKHRDQPNEVTFGVYSPDINVWPDACSTGELPPRTGPTADDLVAALRAQQSSDVSEPAEITVGGLPGLRVDVSVPDDVNPAACVPEALRVWSNAAEDGNFLAFSGPGTAPVYILETSSGRLVLSTGSEPEATAPDLAELQAIIDSIQIEPASPSASESPSVSSATPTANPSPTPLGDIVRYQLDGAPATTAVDIVADGASSSGTAVTTFAGGTHTVRLECAARDGDTWALGGTTEQTTVAGERAGDWSAVIVKDGSPQKIGIWLSDAKSEGSDCDGWLAAIDLAEMPLEFFQPVESGALVPPPDPVP